MNVEFKKTGERRYAVIIQRENLPQLEMNPAPGFDSLMPHDLLHFLVEREFNLKNGIYGQIAAGGTAGTFHIKPAENSDNRTTSRQRRKASKRGEKLLKDGANDCAKSERATYICLYDWFLNSPDENLRVRAAEMKPGVENTLRQMPEAERSNFSREKLARIRTAMDKLSQKWFALKIDQAMTLEW